MPKEKIIPKTYYIKTYGCIMNASDSDKIRYVLNQSDMREVIRWEDADVIILNSCSVRQQAEDKVLGWGIKASKNQLQNKIVVLTGCMAIRTRGKFGDGSKYQERLLQKNSWIDIVLDIRDLAKLPQKLGITNSDAISGYLDLLPQIDAISPVAKIPISTGCDFFCSYCIVPFSRGPMEDRDYDKIIRDVKYYIDQGYKQIYLIGQNVNSWKGKGGRDFADLLYDVSTLAKRQWVTFVSSNPMDFTQRMAQVIGESRNIMRWINLAVQSGSNRVLKSMNRKYTIEEYVDLVGEIRNYIPDLRLTTDIIVGFPGETDEDFQKTVDFVKQVEFDMVYIGKYSPRSGSVAEKVLNDNVPQDVKKERERVLQNIVNDLRDKHHKSFLGKKLPILQLGGHKGLSFYNHEVLIESDSKQVPVLGRFVEVEITGSSVAGLVGRGG